MTFDKDGYMQGTLQLLNANKLFLLSACEKPEFIDFLMASVKDFAWQKHGKVANFEKQQVRD